ncbi:MAG TPA: arsenate reductase ArsC [Candidatus Deferrimicrobiaceae bacterium]|nr:arsenate reductase ArsC [Candidatus Deferrimicrobiaceae bacterium]
MTAPPLRVLVLCTGNKVRSQMAEAFLQRAGGGRVAVSSAGTHPSTVSPLTVKVLAERGFDWSGARSKSLSEFLGQPFNLVVTVCDDAREACPVFPGAQRQIHRPFRDPIWAAGSEDERLREFRSVRDEIEAWAGELAADLLAEADAG